MVTCTHWWLLKPLRTTQDVTPVWLPTVSEQIILQLRFTLKVRQIVSLLLLGVVVNQPKSWLPEMIPVRSQLFPGNGGLERVNFICRLTKCSTKYIMRSACYAFEPKLIIHTWKGSICSTLKHCKPYFKLKTKQQTIRNFYTYLRQTSSFVWVAPWVRCWSLVQLWLCVVI